jgi:hypothetical protein
MNIENLLPGYFIEHEYFNEMVKHLDSKVLKGKTIYLTHNYKELPSYGDNVIVVLAAGDEKGNPPKYHNKVEWVFKHQYDYDGHPDYPDVYHLPLTPLGGFVGDNSIPIRERKYDVSFVGRNQKRQDLMEAIEILDKKYKSFIKFTGYKVWADRGKKCMSIKEYSEIMRNSKIIISPRGAVRVECLRLSEAVKCGCGIITPKYPDVWAFQECMYTSIKNWKNINKRIEVTMKNLDVINKNMVSCWEKYFCPKASATRINQVVGENQ